VPLIQMDETLKGRLIAEAQFLRGFYYFHLVRLFGKVPLVLKETTSLAGVVYPKREEVNVVYQQIIKDFQDAESVLPISYTGADRGRATKGAAKAYLSLVYLTLKDYAKAAEKAKEVMAPEFGYGLWANLTDVFAIPNEFGKEAIFDAQFISGPT
jgi:tetratricopeptide (TPR) repeat protein